MGTPGSNSAATSAYSRAPFDPLVNTTTPRRRAGSKYATVRGIQDLPEAPPRNS